MADALPIFVGYDPAEHLAYEVCESSLRRHTNRELHIARLDQKELRSIGLYDREWRLEEGQRVDCRDGRPFSTEFTFSRFLIPSLTLRQGWALYCDCDFLFTWDVAELFAQADPKYAVMCVKHEHVPPPDQRRKMNGQAQTAYYRKNWSSLVLWNCEHKKNKTVTPWSANHQSGRYLHGFSWLDDEDIGSLPREWNYLVGVDPIGLDHPHLPPMGIHYTLGIPTMPGRQNDIFADLWRREAAEVMGNGFRAEELKYGT